MRKNSKPYLLNFDPEDYEECIKRSGKLGIPLSVYLRKIIKQHLKKDTN